MWGRKIMKERWNVLCMMPLRDAPPVLNQAVYG